MQATATYSIFESSSLFREAFDSYVTPGSFSIHFTYQTWEEKRCEDSCKPRNNYYAREFEQKLREDTVATAASVTEKRVFIPSHGKWDIEHQYFGEEIPSLYKTIETIRKAMLHAMRIGEHQVVLPFTSSLVCVSEVNTSRGFVKCRSFQQGSIKEDLYLSVVRPALEKLLESYGCKMVKEDPVAQKGSQLEINWNPKFIPNYPLPLPQPVKVVKSPMDLILESYLSQQECDVNFVCQDDSIKAHRLILRLSSPIFNRSFHHDLKENITSNIPLPHMPHSVVKAILDYLYLRKDPFENPAQMADPFAIFDLSSTWQMTLLARLAENAIGQYCDPEDYQQIGILGMRHRSKHLLEVYNCYRIRSKDTLTQELKATMRSLGIRHID